MDQLARIYLVLSGFKNKEQVAPLLLEDIRSNIGFTQSTETLKEQTGITDIWMVLGKQTTEEDSLTTERNWLYGTQSNKYALVLQFIIRGQGLAFSLTPGMIVQAELVFYHSAQPLRAIIKRQVASSAAAGFSAYANWQQVAEAETNITAQLPFYSERPYILQNIKPVQYAGSWWLQDNEQKMMQLKENSKKLYSILALSGGEPLNMAVLGKENLYEPLGVWHNQQYVMIG